MSAERPPVVVHTTGGDVLIDEDIDVVDGAMNAAVASRAFVTLRRSDGEMVRINPAHVFAYTVAQVAQDEQPTRHSSLRALREAQRESAERG